MFQDLGSVTASFVAYFIKSTMVLVPALLAAMLAKRRTAAFRHFLLSFSLIGLLLVPVVSLLPFGWRTPLLPARLPPVLKTMSPTLAGPPAEETLGFKNASVNAGPAAASGENAFVSRIAPGPKTAVDYQMGSSAGHDEKETAAQASGYRKEEPGRAFPARPASWGAERGRGGIQYPSGFPGRLLDRALALVWAAGLLILLARLVLGLAGARRMTREGARLDDPAWRILLIRFLSIIPLRRSVRLRSHPKVLVPMTWGWRRPVILLPSGTEAWAETERSTALFHELSHVKRADFLFLFFVRLSLSLFWWNPLCWVVYVRIRREQEIACDEMVLRAGIKPSTYAAGLLAFRRSAGLRWNSSAALPGLFGTPSFQDRLAAILKQKRIIKEVNMKSRIILASAVVLAVALIGSAHPAAGVEAKAETATAPAAMTSPSPAHPAAGQEIKVRTTTVGEKEKDKVQDKDKKQIEIIVVRDGKETKYPRVGPLTISGGKDGAFLILDKDGKEIEGLEGKTWRIELKDGKAMRLGEADIFTIDKDGGQAVVYIKSADGKIDPATVKGIKVIKGSEAGKDGLGIIVEGDKTGESKAAWTVVEPGKDSVAFTITEKDGKRTSYVAKEPLKGAVASTVSEKDGNTLSWTQADKPGLGLAYFSENDKELLEKVKAMREQVAAVKAGKLDIAELEKSLEKLEAGLKDKSSGADVIKVGKFMFGKRAPQTGKFTLGTAIPDTDKNIAYYVTADKEEKGGSVIVHGDKLELGKNASFISEAEEGTSMIVLSGKKGPEGKAAFDRVSARLKKELPEGFKVVEEKYDEKAGTMTFRIEAPAGKKYDADSMRKLVDSLKEELKK